VAEFDGQTALVTGAAGNIGRAVASLLAKRGATVIAADLAVAQTELDATVDLCGDAATAITFDVTDATAITQAIASAADQSSWPNLVFNNAGYQGDFANTLDYSHDDFALVLDVNVNGAFKVLQIAAQGMVERGLGGSIVNTASMAGVSGAPNMVAYSASKAAVVAMTKSAAKDLAASNIRVNAVSPAFIGPGAMWDRQVELQAATPSIYFGDDPATVANQMINMVPLRRYGSLEEVAEVVCFLLSPRASYLTGTNTEISGGSS